MFNLRTILLVVLHNQWWYSRALPGNLSENLVKSMDAFKRLTIIATVPNAGGRDVAKPCACNIAKLKVKKERWGFIIAQKPNV